MNRNWEKALVLLTTGLTVLSVAVAEGLRESEVGLLTDVVVRESADAAYALQSVFPVWKLKGDPALEDITFSARGWRLDVAVDDDSRTASIIAEPGALVSGVFQPGEGEVLTVLAATQGEGSVDWTPKRVEKCVYRLTHSATADGTSDADATCIGYLDFTQCAATKATQAEVEAAVLDDFSHKIAVTQDANLPWQPLVPDAAGSGIVTDDGLAAATVTTTLFAFKGRGTLHYEYMLGGGSLVVQADGVSQGSLAVSTDWQARAVSFEGFGSHEVAFVYTAAGGFAMAALRHVRWEEEDGSARVQREGGESRSDLREGVREPKRAAEILPFAYSCTNWTGVAGATAESTARITVVQMTGTAPDLREWTEEVPGTCSVLVYKPGENVVRWRAKKGVWKAAFDILTDDECVHHEEAWFDLRKTSGIVGIMLIIRGQ